MRKIIDFVTINNKVEKGQARQKNLLQSDSNTEITFSYLTFSHSVEAIAKSYVGYQNKVERKDKHVRKQHSNVDDHNHGQLLSPKTPNRLNRSVFAV